VLQQEWRAQRWNARIIADVLNRADRTVYHYFRGDTELTAEQVLALTVELSCPRLLTAWFYDQGRSFWVRPKLTTKAPFTEDMVSRAEVDGYQQYSRFIAAFEDAREDGDIDHKEREVITREGELAIQQIGALIGTAREASLE